MEPLDRSRESVSRRPGGWERVGVGAGLGGAGAIILGVLTILTAGFNAAGEVIGPGKKAEEHQKAAVRFGSLGVAYNTLVRTWNEDGAAAHRRFEELEDQHRKAETESPEPEQ
jgi:hypothetical protein